jgi:microcystin-dependent protein
VAEIPHIPLDQISDPTSIDLEDDENIYPLLDPIQGPPNPDSVGAVASNRQPRALDRRTETIRDLLNKLVEVTDALNENLLHRDGVDADPVSFMRGNLSMRDPEANAGAGQNYRVTNTADGVDDTDAVTKAQLDALELFLDGLETNLEDYLRRDGSRPMQGDLNMGGHNAVNLAAPVNPDDATTKEFVDGELLSIRTNYIARDGSVAMLGDLNMNGNRVRNLAASPIEDGDAVPRQFVIDAIEGLAVVPVGSFVAFGGVGASTPTGWLRCFGQEVSRTTFADLFLVIGTTFGIGDGSTTFNIPDLRGRLVLGLDNMGGVSAGRITIEDADTIGSAFGAEAVTLTSDQMPEHNHSYQDSYVGLSSGGAAFGPDSNNTNGQLQTRAATTASTGGGTAHTNLQPSMALNWLIKY